MIYSTQDKDEAVALEACEFWLGFAEADELKDHLRPFLPKVAPVLLNGMVYTETDLLWLEGDDEDANVPDRPEDLKPKFYGSKGHAFEREGGAEPSGGKSRNAGDDEDEEESDGQSKVASLALKLVPILTLFFPGHSRRADEDYDDDDDEDAFSSEWNLRKCSAAALDVMSVVFEAELLEILLPYLKEKLFSPEWVQRECGILALGAMAEGCIEGIEPHLPTLVPFLISTLDDAKVSLTSLFIELIAQTTRLISLPFSFYEQPLVRAITCWTIGRYSSWCVNTPAETQAMFFLPAMEGVSPAQSSLSRDPDPFSSR